LFFYTTEKDAPCVRDDWFEDSNSAYEYTVDEFNISPSDWEVIPDPLPGCQDDFIQPVRLKGREKGSPEWGVFEKLVDGEWVEYSP
jgi:hypothetical protein